MFLDLRAFLVTERCRRDRQGRVLSRKMGVVVGSRSHRRALPEESAQAFTPVLEATCRRQPQTDKAHSRWLREPLSSLRLKRTGSHGGDRAPSHSGARGVQEAPAEGLGTPRGGRPDAPPSPHAWTPRTRKGTSPGCGEGPRQAALAPCSGSPDPSPHPDPQSPTLRPPRPGPPRPRPGLRPGPRSQPGAAGSGRPPRAPPSRPVRRPPPPPLPLPSHLPTPPAGPLPSLPLRLLSSQRPTAPAAAQRHSARRGELDIPWDPRSRVPIAPAPGLEPPSSPPPPPPPSARRSAASREPARSRRGCGCSPAARHGQPPLGAELPVSTAVPRPRPRARRPARHSPRAPLSPPAFVSHRLLHLLVLCLQAQVRRTAPGPAGHAGGRGRAGGGKRTDPAAARRAGRAGKHLRTATPNYPEEGLRTREVAPASGHTACEPREARTRGFGVRRCLPRLPARWGWLGNSAAASPGRAEEGGIRGRGRSMSEVR